MVQAAPEASSSAANRDLFGLLPSPIDGLKLGAYGEVKFGSRRNPDHNGQWQSGFDAARLVLLPTFQFTDSIIFNAEIEFEHAGSGFDEDDKLHGTAEIEQLYIDFKVSPYFNVRSPGHRPGAGRLHQPAPRADPVLQRQPPRAGEPA